MNVVRGVVALLLSIVIGYSFSLKFHKKTLFYIAFKDFNNRLKNEISFSKSSIIYLINEFDIENDFIYLVREYYTNNEFNKNFSYLSGDDMDFLNKYLKNIGYTDDSSQMKYLENIDNELNEKRIDALNNEKRYRILYFKLGVFIGLMLLVILL